MLLCGFGFAKELRPSEQYVTEYLKDYKNFTSETVSLQRALMKMKYNFANRYNVQIVLYCIMINFLLRLYKSPIQSPHTLTWQLYLSCFSSRISSDTVPS
jgi:hypothetical protein